MSFIVRCRGFVLLTIALLAFCVPTSQAAYTISVQQVGSDVVTTGSGSIDFTDLTLVSGGFHASPQMQPNGASLLLGPTTGDFIDLYSPLSGPASFGTGGFTAANSGSGPAAGVSGPNVAVSSSYVSGSPLALTTDTYSNQTFSSLGLTPGTYVYTWGTGQDADSLTVQIGAVSAPLPPAAWAGVLGTAVAFAFRRKLIRAA